MAFINEFVSDENVKKYGLEEINQKFRKANVHGEYRWTVDHERDIYLRLIMSGREEFCDQHDFNFYWKGTLLFVRLKREGESVRGGEGASTWTLLHLELPETLNEKKPEILEDLKEALRAYKTSGISSTVTKHTANFTF